MSINSTSDSEVLSRDVKINIAIELYIDCIFLAMYYQNALSIQSVKHVSKAIIDAKLLILQMLSGISLNTLEQIVFCELADTLSGVLSGKPVGRYVSKFENIEILYNRTNVSYDMIRLAKFILSVANQIDYRDTAIVIPKLVIFPSKIAYGKAYVPHEVKFTLTRAMTINADKLWYRIYEGLIFTPEDNNIEDLVNRVCTTINIGMLPDITTGVGVSKFPYEMYVASAVTAKYIEQVNADIYNKQAIRIALLRNNFWLDDNPNIIKTVFSLEADYSDSVSLEDDSQDAKSKENNKENKTEEPTDNAQTDATDTTDPNVEDPAADTETPAETPSDTSDPAPDNSGDQPTDETNSSADDLNNPDESKPKMIGLDLALSNNESVDSFMYKLAVAKYIDNVIEFNHDELPLEKVTLLTRWKAELLFLTDAEETKRFLAELKIKMK